MHTDAYLAEAARICQYLNPDDIDRMAVALSEVKGRVYMVGLGGSLANCIHMAADLRKLCDIDAVAPDNIAELTAWANDEGWPSLFRGTICSITQEDALFVLSVGGGTDTVSASITMAVLVAKELGVKIFGIVGPNGGETARLGDHVIRIPAPEGRVTPHTEAFQMVIAHLLVSHPLLQKRKTVW
jgi:D-sedoheptulose 7-phosphate isomerase